MDEDGHDSTGGGGPAAAVIARRRGASVDPDSPSLPDYSNTAVLAMALGGYRAFMRNMDLDALKNYNEAWSYLLTKHETAILARAAQAPHKNENPSRVWSRLLESHKNQGAIMASMQNQYELYSASEVASSDIGTFIDMVVRYFHLKTTFRGRVDRGIAAILSAIKTAEKTKTKGYDPERAAIWGSRVAQLAQYKKMAYSEAARLRRLARAYLKAAEEAEASIEEYDPKLQAAQRAIQPPERLIIAWTEEFADLDPRTKTEEWKGLTDNYLSFKTREYTESQQKAFLKDDARWQEFVGVSGTELRRRMREKERVLNRLMAVHINDEVRKIFPPFGGEAEDAVDDPVDGSASDAGAN